LAKETEDAQEAIYNLVEGRRWSMIQILQEINSKMRHRHYGQKNQAPERPKHARRVVTADRPSTVAERRTQRRKNFSVKADTPSVPKKKKIDPLTKKIAGSQGLSATPG